MATVHTQTLTHTHVGAHIHTHACTQVHTLTQAHTCTHTHTLTREEQNPQSLSPFTSPSAHSEGYRGQQWSLWIKILN